MARLGATVVVRHPETDQVTVLTAGTDLPDWAEPVVSEHALEFDEESSDSIADEESEASEQVQPYEGVKVADLKAEIEARNASRVEDDQISPSGTKRDDLVAALVADDEAGLAAGDN